MNHTRINGTEQNILQFQEQTKKSGDKYLFLEEYRKFLDENSKTFDLSTNFFEMDSKSTFLNLVIWLLKFFLDSITKRHEEK